MDDESGLFLEFQNLLERIGKTSKHTEKTTVISNFLSTFKGDVYVLFRLLLAREDKRVYNVREKVMLKVLSTVLGCDLQAMVTDLEKGDIGETAKKFFLESKKALSKSILTLKEVDDWLSGLTSATKEDQQIAAFQTILKKCTGDDLKILCKLIDHDLKMFIGPKYALAALHPDAFDAWKSSNNLKAIVDKARQYASEGKGKLLRKMSIGVDLMTPIKPMLARVSKSVEDVVKRCPNGMLCEIKYDGERIQIHKNGDEYKTYSRNLKPIKVDKVQHVSEYIPLAIETADTVILDGEILLMDAETKQPLPFGTLGVHKKKAFKDATVCLFIFDILYLNGETLINKPVKDRRKLLETIVKEIPGRIALTEVYYPKTVEDLNKIFQKTVFLNLEGLVVKDMLGAYAPNMRHWIKMKKEHFDGMGDSADLIVLGAYYGSGNKGGLKSIFLMGVYDPDSDSFKTVCKVANGFTDKELADLQNAIPMDKIEKKQEKCPSWLNCAKVHLPDFVVKDPKSSPVWEIAGAEFTNSTHHTANQISIRFPRMTKARDDKDWNTATSLKELQDMYDQGGINRKTNNDDDESDEVLKSRLSINNFVGNVAEPQTQDITKLIILLVNKSGNWSSYGAFRNVTEKWETPKKFYLEHYEELDLGEAAVLPVKSSSGKILVALLMTLELSVDGAVPQLNFDAFDSCLELLNDEISNKKVTSLHIPKMYDDDNNATWDQMMDRMKHHLKNLPSINVYYKSSENIPASINNKKRPRDDEVKVNDKPPAKKFKPGNESNKTSNNNDIKVNSEDSNDAMIIDSNLFSKTVILFFGIDDANKLKGLTDKLKKTSATIANDDTSVSDITHIVTEKSWEPLFDDVLSGNKNCKIVNVDWIEKSIIDGKSLYTKPFLVRRK
eukprot:TRINITY_DN5220_c0_g1_i2.p1 TRINITY_DN5220_c0_g1~~TRINITY_DN5220_c0_g1_i2.p1  ORF type:complete len:896 (+),score=176.10 TRINITY_DN5220_c0_g1_i2:14-2701(+)